MDAFNVYVTPGAEEDSGVFPVIAESLRTVAQAIDAGRADGMLVPFPTYSYVGGERFYERSEDPVYISPFQVLGVSVALRKAREWAHMTDGGLTKPEPS